jgi:hypothetical protein
MPIKLNGQTSGSVELGVPAVVSGGDVNLSLPGAGTVDRLERAGNILQVVEASTSTEVQVATTTYTDTGLSQSITPSSTSSKILVIISQQYFARKDTADSGGGIRLLRGSTVIHDPLTDTSGPFDFYVGGVTALYDRLTITRLDSPATTSAVTYKTQGRPYVTSNNGSVYFQRSHSSFVVNGTSYITLIEVAG